MFLSSLKNFKLIIGIVIAYCLYSMFMVWHFNLQTDSVDDQSTIWQHAFQFGERLAFLTFFIIITLILRIMIIERPKRLTKQIFYDFRNVWIKPAFFMRGLIMLICLYFFISAFTAMKILIPELHPFGGLDTLFYEIDKTLHFGLSPWQITHTLFSAPLLSFLINFFYNLWFFVLYAIFILQAFIHENEQTRKTYFLSFFLCWIINGTLIATLLSSVGPCYYGLIYGLENGPYAPLMERLNEINAIYPLWALETQDMLWGFYENNVSFMGGGISAMPSLHVSIALIQVFVGYKINKLCGRLLLAFFCMILIGSVHLGWHYAIDGYLSIITTTLIWFGAQWIAKATTKKEAEPL